MSPASNSTPVLLVHGENDTTIPPMASRLAAAQLRIAAFKVELDVERGTGHTVSSAGSQKALSFLKKTLPAVETRLRAGRSSSTPMTTRNRTRQTAHRRRRFPLHLTG
ncbi:MULTISPECIES: prolyl oligopeptidase family serine peptidase [Rhizobium]|uniref:prolyl oligopeptidase family serine peptidase n=1 Tax=Rhizobium TaxID=379 RepID=UPI001EF93EF4|nr:MULTISPECIES: prolyl oligopeptidase family serine peptidase [Rhizobium]ULJ81664.1 prolyl oligopeptidase family serine peptidase [Rhizobium sp. C104]